MGFNLEEYEPVEERIKRFYADHENGRVQTELLSDPNNIQTVVVKAFLYIDDTLVSTGLAFEKAGEGYVNKTSHLENCETSAIGRALANYNYCGNKRPSREEIEKTERAPLEQQPAPQKWGSKTERQPIIDEIGKIMESPTFTDAQRDTVRKSIRESDLEGLKKLRDTWKEEVGIF